MSTPTPPPGRRLDWSEVHARLDRVAEATRRALGPTPEQALALMDERARVLARVPARDPEPSEILEVASFTLAGELYAIETRYITRVVRLTDFTPVPGTPGFLGGVVNLRGEILALIDLRALLRDRHHGAHRPLAGHRPGPRRERVRDHGRPGGGGLHAPGRRGPRRPRDAPRRRRPGALLGVTADARIVLDGSALLADPALYIDQGDEPAGGLGS